MTDIAELFSIILKYGILLFLVYFSIELAWGVVKKAREEPKTLAKLIFMIVGPIALALTVTYYFLYQEIGAPLWFNLIAGFIIYGLSQGFLEKHLKVEFKDEIDNN
jgi:hypothetical protein